MTKRGRDKPQLDPDRLRAGARKVGEALARARGLDPGASRRDSLPQWYAALPPELASLFTADNALWDAVAAREGVAREDLDVDLFEAFDADLWKVNR